MRNKYTCKNKQCDAISVKSKRRCKLCIGGNSNKKYCYAHTNTSRIKWTNWENSNKEKRKILIKKYRNVNKKERQFAVERGSNGFLEGGDAYVQRPGDGKDVPDLLQRAISTWYRYVGWGRGEGDVEYEPSREQINDKIRRVFSTWRKAPPPVAGLEKCSDQIIGKIQSLADTPYTPGEDSTNRKAFAVKSRSVERDVKQYVMKYLCQAGCTRGEESEMGEELLERYALKEMLDDLASAKGSHYKYCTITKMGITSNFIT